MKILLATYLIFCLNFINAQSFESGLKSYEDNNYEDAVNTWKSLIDQGQKSESIYYNIGNAYLQLKNYPEAIYYYNKALRLSPGSKDAEYNLKLAMQFNAIEETELQGWSIGSSLRSISNTTTILNYLVIFSILAILGIIAVKHLRTKYSSIVSKALFTGSLLVLVLAGMQKLFNANHREAILIYDSALYLSPDELSEKKIELKPGEKIQIKDQIMEWSKIQTGNYEIGWILANKYRELED
ncbi:MAG: tetratricopeptide repeat protein [Saprospiraceae bacterium]